MTRNDSPRSSVVPEISPAGNELPHEQTPPDQPADQGPAPRPDQMPAGEVVKVPHQGEGLSSAEVAGMTEGQESVEVNQALEQAQGREDTSQS
ncbi:hypothetical protein [Deinococcus radiophilus]|uniref:Uncharacterized protein n=1 Tax=Deinococcus radiophilus TaxID=32062 RepID=A0A431VQB6_9DEIO|nr:hypothetical protein [Deinococcus radiophilus]RTR25409.1 hypothetical protein EJ104_10985 [Deinococcus radiophilus]UFA50017.1 hypothetical protein LMT64_09025 [Deinococcus radiophilus]